jgi:hypothetical protein
MRAIGSDVHAARSIRRSHRQRSKSPRPEILEQRHQQAHKGQDRRLHHARQALTRAMRSHRLGDSHYTDSAY